MKKFTRIFLIPVLLAPFVSVLSGCSSSNNKEVIYEDDSEDIDLAKAIKVECDYDIPVDPALLKKIDMYNAGCVRPISNYDRDALYCKQMNPNSLRMDISVGKDSGNAGMYLVSDDYETYDYNPETGTFRVDKDSLKYDFSELDEVLSYFQEIDALPYVSWCYIPFPLADNGKFNNLDNNILNWQEVWEEIYYNYAKHYLDNGVQIGYNEIYNEPDLEILKMWGVLDEDDQYFLNIDDFAPRVSPDSEERAPSKGCYPDMYEYGVKGILRANPDATVGGPAFALGELGVEDWVGFLPRVLNKKIPMDFYSFHSYLDGDTWFKSDEQRRNGEKNELEKVVDGLQKSSHFIKTQLHINEYSSLNNDNGALSGLNAPFNYYTGAANTLDAVIEAVDRTSIQLVSWAQLLSVNNLQNDPYGLITPDGQPKAAFNALRIYQDMPVWRYQSKVSLNEDIKCLTSSSDDKISILLWNNGSATDDDGLFSEANDQLINLKVSNPKFSGGTRRVYRIDKDHASYYDQTKTSTLHEQNVKDVNLYSEESLWKGNLPAQSVVYITVNKDGNEDFKIEENYSFANHIKTEYYYEDRYRDLKGSREEYADFVDKISGSYTLFDRKSWKMRLGMGSLKGNANGKYVGQGVASGAIICDEIPENFNIEIKQDGFIRHMNAYSKFGVRIDFYNDSTKQYDNSVYLHNGIYNPNINSNEQDVRLSKFDIYPYGTKGYASSEEKFSGNTWNIDLTKYASSEWLQGSRKATISFEMRNAGVNARAEISLRK